MIQKIPMENTKYYWWCSLIGTSSNITGVKIGNNCVIGAYSVVTDVPDFAIVGGVPKLIIDIKRLI
jgi:acetyltransferase-like isoleucine patch superfamily enzyme